jgi:hypothetical protein
MQGVLGVSATQSGNLLTPLMMGAVIGSITGGQTVSRTGQVQRRRDRRLGPGGRRHGRLRADGAATPRMSVVYGMIIAGLGMGLLQPVYTIAVQNVAPRRQMGAATSSTIFFRSIGSTVGVAAFGSMMLTRYHRDFAQSMPAHVPEVALPYFSNPLLLVQIRPQLDAAFGRVPWRGRAAPELVRQRQNLADERPAPDLRLQRGHHGPGGSAAPAAAERAAAHTRRRAGAGGALNPRT